MRHVPLTAALLALSVLQSASAQSYRSERELTEPVLFAPGIICTGDFESHPAFTPDASQLYFLKSTPAFDHWTIVYSDFKDGSWTTPKTAPFSGQWSDADPFITSDGSRLYFISNRPIVDTPGAPSKDLDIWYVDRRDGGWGDPKRIDTTVNSPANEWHPCVLANGTIYFGSERMGGLGGCDIYRCRFENGQYLASENLGDSVNSKRWEFEPYVSEDEQTLYVMGAGRPEGLGGFDIYVSQRLGGVWSSLVNMGDKVNSVANEYVPMISPDGRYLFWTSARGFADSPLPRRLPYDELVQKIRSPQNGLGNIYQMDIPALKIK